jgi:hypothetical protein
MTTNGTPPRDLAGAAHAQHTTSKEHPVTATELHPTDGPIQDWFELSYTNYQVIPRTLMQSMPIEWQERMVACLEELGAAYQHLEHAQVYKVEAATEDIVGEMTKAELEQAGITEDWYGGKEPPAGAGETELAEWQAEHEQPEPTYSDADGNELDPSSRVLIPVADPVPHYNRGRTYLEPRLSEPAA